MWDSKISRRRFLALTGTALAGTLLGQAVGRSSAAPAVTTNGMLHIGLVLPTTGDRTLGAFGNSAILGSAANRGAILAGDEILGQVGPSGRQFKALISSAPDTDSMLRAARRMTREEGAYAIIGGFTTDDAQALSALAVEDDFISVAETSKPVEPFSKLMPEPNETEAYTETSRLEEQQQAIHFREQAAAHFDLPPRVSKESQSATLSLFDDSESLADKLASPDNSIAARMTNSRINDLRQAIGINDKFLLINELFEGNISYYNKAIDELNSFQSLNGAKTYLIELSVLHQWDAETAAVSKMEQLIERKFGY